MYRHEWSYGEKCSLAYCNKKVVLPTPRAPLIPIIVFLNTGASITKVTGNDNIVSWTRVGITIGSGVSETDARFYSQGSQTGSYVDGTDATDDYHASGLTVNNLASFSSSNIDAALTDRDTNPQYLGSIAPGGNLVVNFAIWVEGTLQNDQNAVIDTESAVSLTMPFYALDYNA